MADITIVAHPSEPRTEEEIQAAIEKLEGIRESTLENGVLTLIYDDSTLSQEAITDALMPIGYSAKYPV